jgi:UDP-N-acetylmuramate: L-alanyl-gamma-D-glutamyl-meso-diaminopimelate ligase
MQTEKIVHNLDAQGVRRIHLLGVCGTGMGAFAGMLAEQGFEITGSDENIYPPMSEMLHAWGIKTFLGYRAENLDQARPDLVVVGNVIRRVNPEATAMRERGLPHASFPAALGELCIGHRHSVVVAGTHGKTTTSALLAHLLVSAGRDPSFLVGGVTLNSSSNFRIGRGAHFVVEGDEYDTAYFDKGPKFLHYRPRSAVFTSMELDHADIYRDLAHYRSSFEKFMSLIPPDGFVAVSASYPAAVEVARAAKAKVETYGLERATWRAEQVHHDGQGAWFDLVREGEKLQRVCLSLGGIHNVENALGATAVAVSLGLSIEEIARGLASFKGVKRRQEIRGEPGGVLVVDDFAHHPTAVRETIKAVSARFPGRPLWAIFEPRSNTSRRNLHQHEYSEAFQGASRAIVAKPLPTDKVPAGEQLDVEALAREIGRNGTPALAAANAEEIVNIARQEVRARDVLLVMSNGAFGGLVEKLLAALAGASR